MKTRAVVSERGTITIPEAIREAADIHSGDMMEFYPDKDRIIMKHLIVGSVREEECLKEEEWGKFDKLVQKQLKKGDYTSFHNIGEAKSHSRKLLHKR